MKTRKRINQEALIIAILVTVFLFIMGAICYATGYRCAKWDKEKELEEATITASLLSDVVRCAMDNGDDCVEEIYYNYADNLDTMKNMPLDSINLDKYVWAY